MFKANISIITHDRRSKSLPIGKTEVLIELETRGYEHTSEVVTYLKRVRLSGGDSQVAENCVRAETLPF